MLAASRSLARVAACLSRRWCEGGCEGCSCAWRASPRRVLRAAIGSSGTSWWAATVRDRSGCRCASLAPSHGGKGACPDSRASRRCRPDPGNCWPPGTVPGQHQCQCLFIYRSACSAPASRAWLHITMLRRLHRHGSEMGDGKLERKRSKRQRIVQFFKPKRLPLHDEVPV
jgi:hypothetical protein